jgi:hypothetical protein
LRLEEAVSQRTPQTPKNNTSLMQLFLRLLWMMFGNAVVFFAAAYIVTDSPGELSHVDIIYWLGAAALIGARLLDITRYNGKTADGEPATLAHGLRYSVVVAAVATTVWLAIHMSTGTFT